MNYEALGRYTYLMKELRKLETERNKLIKELCDGFKLIFQRETGFNLFHTIDFVELEGRLRVIKELSLKIESLHAQVCIYAEECNETKPELEVIRWKS